jgi:hypothetical protein
LTVSGSVFRRLGLVLARFRAINAKTMVLVDKRCKTFRGVLQRFVPFDVMAVRVVLPNLTVEELHVFPLQMQDQDSVQIQSPLPSLWLLLSLWPLRGKIRRL